MRKCKLCNDTMTDTKSGEEKQFCSPYCRERHWRLHNKQRHAAHQKKYRLKTPVICRFCQKEIPLEIRKSGLVFCSDECRVNQEKFQTKKRRENTSFEFANYKKNIGCKLCKYNKNGACLDFHHIDETIKSRRITSALWKSNTLLFKEEIKKCILVCKNCHYEIHHPQ